MGVGGWPETLVDNSEFSRLLWDNHGSINNTEQKQNRSSDTQSSLNLRSVRCPARLLFACYRCELQVVNRRWWVWVPVMLRGNISQAGRVLAQMRFLLPHTWASDQSNQYPVDHSEVQVWTKVTCSLQTSHACSDLTDSNSYYKTFIWIIYM